MPKSAYAQEVGGWDALVTSLGKRAEEVPHLAEQCARLAQIVAQVKALDGRKLKETARLRTTTRQLQEARTIGRELESRLRAGLRGVFGSHAPDLIAFGGRPLRRPRRGQVPSIEPPPEPEGEGGPN
ncbi:MAG TPA: hypothetical protein VOA87_13475 [Thermoanaerobaculia bacterium]|nr:hypothetical protein [Thermoanaerobaculia bacterium]